MTDRSNIDLLANATTGVNLGVGECIFKCKNITGNTLQFKTISVAGGLSIITGDTTLTISGVNPVLSGFTDYLLKGTTTGVTISSIFDSGATNIYIAKDNIFIGSSNSPTTIKPQGSGCMCLVAQGGVIIGNLTNSIFTNGSDLCSRTCNDLIIGAGSATVSGIGKKLYLRGGTGISASGGTVVICGGSGSSNGRIQTPNLPAKSTETCVVYIDAGGNLSKGVVSTGITISGIATRIPVFNATGNNISATTMSFIANTLCNPNDLTIQVANTKNIFLHAPISANANQITLGSPNMVNTINANMVQSCGMASDISLRLFAKGNGQVSLHAPVVFLGNNGTFGLKYTQIGGALEFPIIGRICSCNGDQYNPEAKSMTLMGGCGYGAPTFAGSGATVYICGGDAASGTGTAKAGGSVAIKAGLGVSGGANGRVILTGLPAKTTESCVVYIDSTGKLSAGVSSGGTGGLSVAVTGATNGVCLYNSKNVCLGGLLSAPVLICNTNNSNGLTLCTISTSTDSVNNTYIGSGNFVSTSTRISTSWCTYIENGGIQINLLASNIGATCSNQLVIRPDMVQLTSNGGGSNSGWQYAADYCTKMNSNERAIVDSGWVKRYTIGGWSNFARGTTVMGCGTVVSGGTICCDTFFGAGAGASITTGRQNVGIGTLTLQAITSGCFNTAVGAPALTSTSTGCYNTGVGWGVLNANVSGHFNTAFGMNASSSNGTGSCNTALGNATLYANSGGNDNVAVGNCALASNTVSGNVAIGACALLLNNSGVGNLAVGQCALLANLTGLNNLAIGHCALRTTTVGSNNIAIGKEALFSNTASENIAIGLFALRANTTGIGNTAIGVNTLQANTIGFQNVAIGCYAMFNNTGGTYNIGIGYQALLTNRGGSNNIGIGNSALQVNTSGSNNIGIGNSALQVNTSGCDNIAIGRISMVSNTLGNCNIVLGLDAFRLNTSGCQNVAIGSSALYNNTTGSTNVAIGRCAGYFETGSSRLHIGNCGQCSLIYGEFDNNYVKICGCLEASGAIKPASSTDAGMSNNSIYYSTTAGKLVYKDAGGVVHDLY